MRIRALTTSPPEIEQTERETKSALIAFVRLLARNAATELVALPSYPAPHEPYPVRIHQYSRGDNNE